MKEQYLTLNQNLCSAKIFLNIFGLVLEEKEEAINEFTKLKIFNADNLEVGILSFENGVVKIQSLTDFGNLNANYDIAKLSGFEDLECGGVFAQWKHDIKFKVDSIQNFDGDMQIAASMDTDFGNNCTAHTILKYKDGNDNDVELKFMEDGKLFSYKAKKGDYEEVLEIAPWDDFDAFMYHTVRNGKYDEDIFGFANEVLKLVWYNGGSDRNHLKALSRITKNSKIIEAKSELHESVGKNDSVESTIQKGLLMQQIDPDFSKKIDELIGFFKKGDISFFANLIDVTLNKVNSEERKALFGIDMEKMDYYNETNNLIDAYFGVKENSKFLPNDVFSKVMKR